MEMQQIKLSKNPIGYQIYFAIIGLGGLGIVIGCISQTTIRPLPSILLILFFLPKIWLYIKSKKVVYCNNSIIVSNYSKNEVIPVENIHEISILGKKPNMLIQIELKVESEWFGKIIIYIPKNKILIPSNKKKSIHLAPGMLIKKY